MEFLEFIYDGIKKLLGRSEPKGESESFKRVTSQFSAAIGIGILVLLIIVAIMFALRG